MAQSVLPEDHVSGACGGHAWRLPGVEALHGTDSLPAAWIDPLDDHVRSAIFDFDHSRISELAERTVGARLGEIGEAAIG
jgi:hypothetical protein